MQSIRTSEARRHSKQLRGFAIENAIFASRCAAGAPGDPCRCALPQDNRFRASEWQGFPFNARLRTDIKMNRMAKPMGRDPVRPAYGCEAPARTRRMRIIIAQVAFEVCQGIRANPAWRDKAVLDAPARRAKRRMSPGFYRERTIRDLIR